MPPPFESEFAVDYFSVLIYTDSENEMRHVVRYGGVIFDSQDQTFSKINSSPATGA